MQEKTKIWHELGRPTQNSFVLRILLEKHENLIDSYHKLFEDKFQEKGHTSYIQLYNSL